LKRSHRSAPVRSGPGADSRPHSVFPIHAFTKRERRRFCLVAGQNI
jgi:hypothetical protein